MAFPLSKMQLDSQKLLLLRSYARERSSSDKPSPSGLEKFLPRTSSPTRESLTYVDNNHVLDPYELFRHHVERPPRRVSVRGMQQPPDHFISGHFIPPPKPAKPTLKTKFAKFKKIVKDFFDKYYWNLIRNKCDYCSCPPTCECQRNKSLLNKTVFLGDDEEIK